MFSRRVVKKSSHCSHCPEATSSQAYPVEQQQQFVPPAAYQQPQQQKQEKQYAAQLLDDWQYSTVTSTPQQQQSPAVGFPVPSTSTTTTSHCAAPGAAPPACCPPTVSTSASGVTSVFLTLGKQGDHVCFPDGYSLELAGKLTRDEFSAIVAELNATAHRADLHASGCTFALLLCPCTSICTAVSWKHKLDDLKEDLHATCCAINARNEARGNHRVNLVYREAPFDRHGSNPAVISSAQVEVQVLG